MIVTEGCPLDTNASALLGDEVQPVIASVPSGIRASAPLQDHRQQALVDITALAADLCDAAGALLTVFEGSIPQRIVAVSPGDWGAAPDLALCSFAGVEQDTVIIGDMRRDPRLADHPMVRVARGLRFQAATPVRSPDGALLGTLHVFDIKVRPKGLSDRQIRLLQQTAGQAFRWLANHQPAPAPDNDADAEQRLRGFRAVFDHAAIGLARVGRDGRLLEVNDFFCAIAGQTREDLITGQFQPSAHADTLAADCARIPTLLTGEPPHCRMEKRYVRGDGSAVWVALTGSRVPAADGAADSFTAVIEDITERKNAEAQRERLAQIVEHSPDFIGFTDTKGRVTFINRAGRRMIGLDDAAELTGLHFTDYIAAESQPLFKATVLPTVRSGEVWEGQMQLRHLGTGAAIDVRRSAFALRDSDGHISGYGTVTRDLTVANRMEARISLALSAGRMGIWEWDIAADHIHWSDETYTIFGQDRTQFRPTLAGFEALVYPADRDSFRAQMQAALASGDEYQVEARFLCGGGAVRWMHGRGQIRRDSEGRPLSVLGTVADVTERRETERALRESEELNRRMLEASPDCIKLVGLDGRLEYFSEGGLCAMEVDDFDAQLNGKDWTACWPPESQPIVRAAIASAIAGTTSRFQAFCPTAKGTPKWWDVWVSAITGADGRPERLLSVSRDMTELHHAEQQLRQRGAELAHVQRIVKVGGYEVDLRKGFSSRRSPEYLAIHGLPPEAWNEKHEAWADRVHPDDRARAEKSLVAAVESGAREYSTEYRIIRANDGATRWISVFSTIERDAEGRPLRLLGAHLDITDRKRIEEELARSDRRFRAIFDHQFQFSALLAPDRKVLEVSESPLRHSGVPREAIIGCDFLEAPWWRDLPDAKASWQQLIADARTQSDPARGETPFKTSDGTLRHALNTVTALRDERGELEYLLIEGVDITDRMKAEEELRASERALRDLNQALQLALDSAYAIAFIWDIETDRVARLFSAEPGLPATPDDTLAGVLAAVHPDDRAQFRANLDRALAHPADDYNNEFRIRRPDGTMGWLEERGKLERDAEGMPVRLIGISMDFTERKEAEAALRASREQLAVQLEELNGLYAEAPLGLALLDRELRFVRINPALAEINGLPVEAHIGRRAWDLMPELRQSAEPALRRVLETGEPLRDVTVTGSTPAEPGVVRHWNEQFYPLRDLSGAVIGIGVICEEVTDRKRALAALEHSREQYRILNEKLEERVAERTAALQQANARLADEVRRREATQAALVQAQKLEALGQLTSGIAHDFNNIVAAISGGFSVIERRTSDPRLIEVSRHGVKAAERGAALVKQLLAFARQQVLAPVTVRLTHLFAEAEPLLRRSVGDNVYVTLDCPSDLWPVRVDPVQLETALINLAVNARDAMPDGGTLTIAARGCPAGDAEHPSELGFRDAVAIRVTDTGTGMEPDILRHVVEPFFTTKGPGKGTGLGLPMVHGFAHQSGGTLKIESEVGQGTTITLFLPRSDAMEELVFAAEAARDIPRHHGGATLLLVDDDEQVRAVTAAQLSDLGYTIIAAGSGQDALDRLAADPAIDAVLSDVVMPGMDGPAMAAAIAAQYPALPIMFMTGRADLSKLAGQSVIEKPFTPSELAHAVLELLGRERRSLKAD